MTRAGIVAVVGKPNAGKSTLLNRIIGQKLSITSPKPQSTRDRILGVHTTDDTQLIIADTPGLLAPQYALQRAMRGAALSALADADVIAYIVEASEMEPPTLEQAAQLVAPPRAPVITVCNKIDALNPRALSRRRAARPSDVFIPLSGRRGRSTIDALLRQRARTRDRARTAPGRSPLQRRLRDRGIS
jgi:GTP-binding protein Era